MPKEIIRAWYFRSSSGDKVHETLAWVEEQRTPIGKQGTQFVRQITLTCSCPGWTKRCNNGERTCKHVRLVMADPLVADRQAVSVKDFGASAAELAMIQAMTSGPILGDYPEQPFYTEAPKKTKPERRKPNAATSDASSRLFNFGDEP